MANEPGGDKPIVPRGDFVIGHKGDNVDMRNNSGQIAYKVKGDVVQTMGEKPPTPPLKNATPLPANGHPGGVLRPVEPTVDVATTAATKPDAKASVIVAAPPLPPASRAPVHTADTTAPVKPAVAGEPTPAVPPAKPPVEPPTSSVITPAPTRPSPVVKSADIVAPVAAHEATKKSDLSPTMIQVLSDIESSDPAVRAKALEKLESGEFIDIPLSLNLNRDTPPEEMRRAIAFYSEMMNKDLTNKSHDIQMDIANGVFNVIDKLLTNFSYADNNLKNFPDFFGNPQIIRALSTFLINPNNSNPDICDIVERTRNKVLGCINIHTQNLRLEKPPQPLINFKNNNDLQGAIKYMASRGDISVFPDNIRTSIGQNERLAARCLNNMGIPIPTNSRLTT